jgi:chromosome segregation ATPase
MLGVLAAAVGWAGYAGSTRANKTQAVGVPVESDAYTRAKLIYEGALDSMEEQLARLRAEIASLRAEIASLSGEVSALRTANSELRLQVAEMQGINAELHRDLERARGNSGGVLP